MSQPISQERHWAALYLLQRRQYNVFSLPNWIEQDCDGCYFSNDMADVPDDTSAFANRGDISENALFSWLINSGWDGVTEHWLTEAIFLTGGEAREFGETKAYNYPEGWRVIAGCARGALVDLIKETRNG